MELQPFPLYDELCSQVVLGKGKESELTHENYKRVFDALSSEWISYFSTVVDLIITRFYRLKKIPEPMCIESNDMLSREYAAFPDELRCILTVLIEKVTS